MKITTFAPGQARDVENVIATQLEGLTDELGECHLLLDFTNVDRINSEELGAIIRAHRNLVAAGGRLTLFNLSPDVYEVFTVAQLHTFLGICRE